MILQIIPSDNNGSIIIISAIAVIIVFALLVKVSILKKKIRHITFDLENMKELLEEIYPNYN